MWSLLFRNDCANKFSGTERVGSMENGVPSEAVTYERTSWDWKEKKASAWTAYASGNGLKNVFGADVSTSAELSHRQDGGGRHAVRQQTQHRMEHRRRAGGCDWTEQW